MGELLSVLLPQNCLSCQRVGAILCPQCTRSVERIVPIRGQVIIRHPIAGQPPQSELISVAGVAAGVYAETLRDCLVGLKRTGSRELYRLLVPLTANALELALGTCDPRRPMSLVPVSSGGKTRRGFGGDLVRSLLVDSLKYVATRGSVMQNRRVEVHDHIHQRRTKKSQKMLSSTNRQHNIAGALQAKVGSYDCATHTHMIFDDVITTGATIREAVRAMAQAGLDVDAVTCVAARPRALGLTTESTLAAYQSAAVAGDTGSVSDGHQSRGRR